MTTRPTNGQIVTIHYTGTLYEQGDSVVDSRNSFTFTLGDGDVIMGMEDFLKVCIIFVY